VTQILVVAAAIVCGAVLALQVGVNLQFRNSIGDPITAALYSFVIGTVGLVAYALLTRAPLLAPAPVNQIPLWQWTGGLLGGVYVVATVILAPRLGGAVLLSLVIAGQMLTAVVLDHFGWLGFAQHSANLWRLVGVGLLIAGAILILRN